METKNIRKELEARLIARALKDESFRNDLRSDPKTAIEKELGMEIPGEINIRLVEENENEVCLVIPHDFPIKNELADVELESLYGGTLTWVPLCFHTFVEDGCK